jgi:hypothetical protein
MATKRKAKRYDEGGVTEGENMGIDDDVRARALKFVRDREENPGMYEAEPEVESVVETKTKAKPKAKSVETTKTVEVMKGEPAKKMNVLEEAKDIARRRASGANAVRSARDARMSYGRGPGLSALKGMKSGGSVSSASRRADGAASKGKTKGRMV